MDVIIWPWIKAKYRCLIIIAANVNEPSNPFDLSLFLSGAIFDTHSRETQSAFSYEIVNVNSDSTHRGRLDVNSQTTQTNDSFSVASACRYMGLLPDT